MNGALVIGKAWHSAGTYRIAADRDVRTRTRRRTGRRDPQPHHRATEAMAASQLAGRDD